jgi:polyhydroxybutyrate depolymerase
MFKALLVPLAVVVLFTNCKKSNPGSDPAPVTPEAASQTTKTITVDGLNREYIIYLPSAWNTQTTALPLLFALHGGGGTDSGMISLASFNSLAESNKFIVIYPQGTQKNWNDGRPTPPNQAGVNDVNFIRTLITTLSTTYKIDAKRIYATGISNGAFMSSRLGSELSDKIAAFASVAGTMDSTVAANCNPANKVAALFIHGTTDPLVPFAGGTMTSGSGGTITSHAAAVAKWVSVDGASATAVTTNITDAVNDGTSATRKDYNNGTNGTAVTSIIILNGGHTWPQGSSYVSQLIVGKTCQDFNGCQTIWDFFKAHPKP